jgi:hypothetical protein
MKDYDEAPAGRSQVRQFVALIVIGAAVAHSLGSTLRMPSHLEANDISRWCTVWSLVERGTYQIDDCPWQNKTQDKVYKFSPFEKDNPNAKKHFYSSKPPLLPTLVAGLIYPIRKLTGVPLDSHVLQQRIERTYRKYDPTDPTKFETVTETPEPVKWPVYVFYFKSVIVLLNILPYLIFLILFARLLDRLVTSDWAWFAGITAAAWATPLTIFNTTLNNHSIAAFCAFFAIYALMKVWESPESHESSDLEQPAKTPYGAYAAAGFLGAFTVCNELPAAALGGLLFLAVLIKSPKATFLAFLPAAIIPVIPFMATLYLATGGFTPFYAEFGTASYTGYEGSYWNTPLEMDWFDKHPEPKAVYLFHMMLGHHGMFSLTPIFLLAIIPMLKAMFSGEKRLTVVAWITFNLSVVLIGYYTYKTNNYGGSTQGLRWLFWIFPLWLIFVPKGFESGQDNRWMRGLGLLALGLSIMTVGYGMRIPWSHPWILDMIEHMNLYTLTR